MSQEPSLLPDLSTRAAQEYSDLFAVSGTSFLDPIDHTSNNLSSSIETSALLLPSSSSAPIPDQSSLIDFVSATPVPPQRIYSSNPKRSHATNSHLIDHSISSFDLLPPALSPSSPSCRINTRIAVKSSPHRHQTPLTSPTKSNKVLSTPFALRALSDFPSNPESSKSASSNLTRTQSVDLLGLYKHPSPQSTIPRSKSSNAIENNVHQVSSSIQTDLACQPKVTKSILKRPNSPSKGARARFFSPRSIPTIAGDDSSDGNESSWMDENGNLRAREIIHEFQKDQPPMSRPSNHVKRSSNPQALTPRARTSSSASSSNRRHHLPKFTIPEPIDLGIEPILPRKSTSPSPSPPSLPPSSYLMNLKDHRKSSSAALAELGRGSGQPTTRSTSNSLVFNPVDVNLPNLLDESGGFLVGDETTWAAENKGTTTELSIDLNHVAMMKILGKQSSHQSSDFAGLTLSKLNREKSECDLPEEEEESVDVFGLATRLEKSTKTDSLTNVALKDEQVPSNLQASQDFSTTFEISGLNLPPLLTDQNEVWKNSKPKQQMIKSTIQARLDCTNPTRTKRNSMSSFDRIKVDRKFTDDNHNMSPHRKNVEPVKPSSTLSEDPSRFIIQDDLFSELMADPLLALASAVESCPPINRPNVYKFNSKNSTEVPSGTRPLKVQKKSSVSGVSFPSKVTTTATTVDKITSVAPISKPRLSSQSMTMIPPTLRTKRNSNVGLGVPSSSSSTTTNLRMGTITTNGTRTKMKPSTAIKAAISPPKMLKSRSSISMMSMNSPKLKGSPKFKNTKFPSTITTTTATATTQNLSTPKPNPVSSRSDLLTGGSNTNPTNLNRHHQTKSITNNKDPRLSSIAMNSNTTRSHELRHHHHPTVEKSVRIKKTSLSSSKPLTRLSLLNPPSTTITANQPNCSPSKPSSSRPHS